MFSSTMKDLRNVKWNNIRVDVSHNVGGFFNLAVAHFSGLTNQKSSFYMTLAIILFFPGV